MFKIAKKRSINKLEDKNKNDQNEKSEELFRNMSFYILQNGMGKKRADLFKNHLINQSANLIDENNDINFSQADNNETQANKQDEFDKNIKWIVIFDETVINKWDQLENSLNKKSFFISFITEFKGSKHHSLPLKFVKSSWLSECLKQKKLISIEKYEIKPNFLKQMQLKPKNEEQDEPEMKKFKTINDESNSKTNDDQLLNLKKLCEKHSSIDSDGSNYSSENEDELEEKFEIKNEKFIVDHLTCAHSSQETKTNPNKFITDKLEELAKIYESTKDKFRANSYQKAIMALKRCKEPIKSKEEALKLPGVGKAIANKIWEIIETGEVKKLDSLKQRDDIASLQIFTNIHGVGPTTAQSFYSQGFRTLEDVKEKAHLNKQQQIGIKYYYEFLERIPRDEVTEIEKYVRDVALSLDDRCIAQACGSYRRGKASCGDVDILVTHPDGHSHKTIFPKLIEILHEKKFLTDDLMYQEDSGDSQRKYLGVCQLPKENSLHRRLDIISVPYDEYACALLYFTGSAHFNRSMRLLASKMGLSLSEKSLSKNVIRKGNVKVNNGQKLKTLTEEDVFKLLNLTYREPQERDF